MDEKELQHIKRLVNLLVIAVFIQSIVVLVICMR